MAESKIPNTTIKKYVMPKQTFTFVGNYHNLGNYSLVASKSRIVGVYVSSWMDNTCPVALALGSDEVYAVGVPNGQITDLEVTITYV